MHYAFEGSDDKEIIMTVYVIRSATDRRTRRIRQIRSVLFRVLETLQAWHDRSVQRDQLARLSEYQLHDIGLSRSMIHNEIEKPFWRA